MPKHASYNPETHAWAAVCLFMFSMCEPLQNPHLHNSSYLLTRSPRACEGAVKVIQAKCLLAAIKGKPISIVLILP